MFHRAERCRIPRSIPLALLFALSAGADGAVAAETGTGAPFKPVDTLPRVATPHFNFVTLVVADMDRAFAFYTRVLGLHERGRAMPGRDYFEVVMGFDDAPTTPGISLTYRNGAPNPRGNGSSSINLVVRDLAGIVARVVPAGGALRTPLVRGETPKARYSLARIEDPDGNQLELVEYHSIASPPGAGP